MPLKWKLPSKYIMYTATIKSGKKKRITNPEIIKKLVKTHSKNDTQTMKDHSTSIGIKTIRNYPSSTGT